ncbi:multiple coagulation factor deficiency protein 2 homolog [Octopus bimaculoides]|uniref:EF-hand domain-containing protein n=1 Tax=Octopus bimaculoides TaxID=37653 RepID=A0A0L8FLP7_OCTBM|nr:multiple coagulation factor deficiency protein 2 homolog [Octopus bimaculoides]XP_052827386.1 multiple coagulation factor deficiency protein 2 homolog [Octopus bimaculoides]|eukprot:XP_014788740.1 PREDICTED: multiple coagulation factor deficiency protein 2 homolog [Octopus bimaculoides]
MEGSQKIILFWMLMSVMVILIPGHRINTASNFYHSSIIEDEKHIRSHLQEITNIGEKELSPEEIEFHFFKLHDLNNDTLLDGLEILAALFHSQPTEDIVPGLSEQEMKLKSRDQIKKIRKERQEKVIHYYTDIIDEVFEKDDLNDDGYLDYMEFTRTHRRNQRRFSTPQEKEIHVTKPKP